MLKGSYYIWCSVFLADGSFHAPSWYNNTSNKNCCMYNSHLLYLSLQDLFELKITSSSPVKWHCGILKLRMQSISLNYKCLLFHLRKISVSLKKCINICSGRLSLYISSIACTSWPFLTISWQAFLPYRGRMLPFPWV